MLPNFMPTMQCWHGNLWYLAPFIVTNGGLLPIFGLIIPFALRWITPLFPVLLRPIWRDIWVFIHFCGLYHGFAFLNTFVACPIGLDVSGSLTIWFAGSAMWRMFQARVAVRIVIQRVRALIAQATAQPNP